MKINLIIQLLVISQVIFTLQGQNYKQQYEEQIKSFQDEKNFPHRSIFQFLMGEQEMIEESRVTHLYAKGFKSFYEGMLQCKLNGNSKLIINSIYEIYLSYWSPEKQKTYLNSLTSLNLIGLCEKLLLSYRKEIKNLKKKVKEDVKIPNDLKIFLEKRFQDFDLLKLKGVLYQIAYVADFQIESRPKMPEFVLKIEHFQEFDGKMAFLFELLEQIKEIPVNQDAKELIQFFLLFENTNYLEKKLWKLKKKQISLKLDIQNIIIKSS